MVPGLVFLVFFGSRGRDASWFSFVLFIVAAIRLQAGQAAWRRRRPAPRTIYRGIGLYFVRIVVGGENFAAVRRVGRGASIQLRLSQSRQGFDAIARRGRAGADLL